MNFQFEANFPPRHLLASADGSRFAFAFLFLTSVYDGVLKESINEDDYKAGKASRCFYR